MITVSHVVITHPSCLLRGPRRRQLGPRRYWRLRSNKFRGDVLGDISIGSPEQVIYRGKGFPEENDTADGNNDVVGSLNVTVWHLIRISKLLIALLWKTISLGPYTNPYPHWEGILTIRLSMASVIHLHSCSNVVSEVLILHCYTSVLIKWLDQNVSIRSMDYWKERNLQNGLAASAIVWAWMNGF